MLSNCFVAWLKYRPSVARAALSCVMTAHPAEPLKPEINFLLSSQGAIYSEEWLSSDGTTIVRHFVLEVFSMGGALRLPGVSIV